MWLAGQEVCRGVSVEDTQGEGREGGEEEIEEHQVHLVDHHLAREATVQLEPAAYQLSPNTSHSR